MRFKIDIVKSSLFLIIFSLYSINIFPQEIDTTKRSLSELSLAELTQVKVSVTSKKEQTIRESAGIVTLITKNQIQASGARDLIDVLRTVPGIEFGIDVRGVVSIGLRGNWAHEGKILILWDGQVMNEILFPSLQLGNHYPVDLIERIEIIRGPGSAIYGGMAELGVINIITTPAVKLNGASVNSTYGVMEKTYGRQNFSFALAEKRIDYSFDLSLFAGSANRSDRIMTDFHPDNPYHSYDMTKQSPIKSFFFNGGVNYQGLKMRLIIDKYLLNDRTMYGINKPSAPEIIFNTYIFDTQYNWDINNRLKLTPRLTYTQNAPWQCLDKNYAMPTYLDKWSERYAASMTANYQLSSKINSIMGIEFYADKGLAGDSSYYSYVPTKKELIYTNTAIFAQGIFINDIADLTLGARFETNSETGNSFVPRIALTKIIDRFHFKLLYSTAFRSPGIENISRYASVPIEPEKTEVAEFETGYQISSNISVTANVFNIRMLNPIIFYVDAVYKRGAYHNSSQSGTMGFEAEFHLKTELINSSISYSYYAANNNEVPDYVVYNNSNLLLGFPQHKISFYGKIILTNDFTANLTATYLSERYADNDVAKIQFTQKPLLLANIFFNKKNFLIEDLSVGIGVYDLFNSKYSFIQPYNGGSAPLPGPSREFVVKISYQRNF